MPLKYRFHIASLPHTQTTREYSNCAFAQLTRRFAEMMVANGHEAFLYSGEDNDAVCTEHVPCITKDEQVSWFDVRGPEDILKEPFVHKTYLTDSPWWPWWNRRLIDAMKPRVRQRDFICLIGGGVLFEPLIAAFQQTIPVEYAIGYGGVSGRTHHCFASSNWQHVVFGLQRYDRWRGRFYDRCIPHYFDPREFEFRATKGDYMLYLGKLKEDKGINVAARAAKAAGARLILAGQGPTPVEYGEVLNRWIGPDERRELLAGARALFVPSLYVEPFGMVAVEALLSGTPLITTPWGGLGEINVDGRTGFHCHNLRDFVEAARNIDKIEPGACRMRGARYEMDAIRHEYQRWFDDLYDLWDGGWDNINRGGEPQLQERAA